MSPLWTVAGMVILIGICVGFARIRAQQPASLNEGTAKHRLYNLYFKPRKKIDPTYLGSLERVAGVYTDQELLGIVGQRRQYDDIEGDLQQARNNVRLPLWVVRHMFYNSKVDLSMRVRTLRIELEKRCTLDTKRR